MLFDLEEIKDLKDDDRNDAVAGELRIVNYKRYNRGLCERLLVYRIF